VKPRIMYIGDELKGRIDTLLSEIDGFLRVPPSAGSVHSSPAMDGVHALTIKTASLNPLRSSFIH
jgi:hypothetical protein